MAQHLAKVLQASVPAEGNRLLAKLSHAELRALGPGLEHVRLPLGRSLHEPGEPFRYVFFPTSGIVSLLYVDATGASAQLTVIGREGMIGLAPLLGGDTASSRAVVQAPGSAYRLRVADARAAFAEGGRFQTQVLRFAHALMLELSQSAVCNLRHVLDQQLCRWLLLSIDRLERDEIHMTHEMIAAALGVRRQGITEAAKKLQEREAIRYARGRITVLDRAALERSACECYRLLKRQTEALLAAGE